MGSCGMHDRPRKAVHMAMNTGYYWPNMHRDANNEITSRDSCQGMDIVGPFLEAPGRIKYLIVVVHYFTKWLEAKPITSITDGLGIKLVSTSVYHPQANRVVERANQSIMQGIKTRLHQEGAAWVEELPNVLWAYRTMPKTSNKETPFSLAYDTEPVIPVEICIPIGRITKKIEEGNKEALRLNLNLLEERREIMAIQEARSRVTTRIMEKLLGDEGLCYGGTKLKLIFITAEIRKKSPRKQNFDANHEGYRSRKRPHEQAEQWLDNEISFPSTLGCQLVDSPIILEALIEGYLVRKIYVDRGSSSEVMYEHYFQNLRAETREKLKESRTPLVGFSGETAIDMIGIPRFIAEHELKTYPHIEPMVQRKRSIAPDKRKVVKEEVAE
ncbi:reverse transcriptase domain-containing protein [Tanacetum coccineum]|uniref:Reverse transcriptase domain-containing protein n=1 Tax=Tanacetum coccineum TaxID=301880 RepID=A0ABQ4XFK6_9ASTR